MKNVIIVVCIGGWKYSGQLVDTSYNLISGMKWVKIKTAKGHIVINSEHIVSILYADPKN